jgi:tetratricopeptide (TPR) repeat protein
MNKTQWIAAGTVLLLTACLYALTQDRIFGYHPKPVTTNQSAAVQTELSVDSILFHARENISPEQRTRINFLENSISRGDVKSQKAHIYHQLARFWKDSARIFEPYAWYTAEAARLENSENSLTFAARLFLDNLQFEGNPALRNWKALQAKDLYERSLRLNPGNDSSKIGLGSVYLFGGVGGPMEGIQMIREVSESDPSNVYAQMTLGQASLISGQLDRAYERFKKVSELDPGNWKALLAIADISERKGNLEEARDWYSKSIPYLPEAAMKMEVQKRINELNK